LRGDVDRRRDLRGNEFTPIFGGLSSGDADADGIELADFASDDLGKADIGNDDVLFARFAGLWGENPGDGVGAKDVVDEEMDGFADLEVEIRANPNGIGRREKHGCPLRSLAGELGEALTDKIKTYEGDGFTLAFDRGEVFDARSEIERVGKLGETAKQVFVKATGRG
jgi:hypothetical protein